MENSIRTYGQRDRRIWIDVCKFFAIMGVLINHVNGILYTNQFFAWLSFYSVSLFILVSGYNTFLSYNRKPYGIYKVVKKCNGMIIPYAVAVLVFDIVSDGYFSLQDYLYMLVHFDASEPHYYVLLYLQLVILGPFIANIISSNGRITSWLKYILVLTVSIIISIFTTNHTDLLGVYGGGGRLAGGSYLILFVVGMIIAKESKNFFAIGRKSLFLIIVLVIAVLCWVHFIFLNKLLIDSKLPLGAGFNPPSISLGLYATLLFLLFYFIDIFAESFGVCKYLNLLVRPLTFIGGHTLYIFLYHRLFLDYINVMICSRNTMFSEMYNNPWIRRIWILIIMIFGPILIEVVAKRISKNIGSIYLGGKP